MAQLELFPDSHPKPKTEPGILNVLSQANIETLAKSINTKASKIRSKVDEVNARGKSTIAKTEEEIRRLTLDKAYWALAQHKLTVTEQLLTEAIANLATADKYEADAVKLLTVSTKHEQEAYKQLCLVDSILTMLETE